MLLIGPLASATMFKKLILPYFVLNFKVVGIPYTSLKFRKSPRVAQHTTNWPQHQCYGYRPTGLAQVIWRKKFFDKLLKFRSAMWTNIMYSSWMESGGKECTNEQENLDCWIWNNWKSLGKSSSLQGGPERCCVWSKWIKTTNYRSVRYQVPINSMFQFQSYPNKTKIAMILWMIYS